MFIYYFIIVSSLLFSNSIQINEIISSNQGSYFDEDGDTPDWIEIYNNSNDIINLEGWSISDDSNDLNKWTFPNFSIPANGYSIIFASDKNRKSLISQWDTILQEGDNWYYKIGTEEPPLNWNQLGFNLSNWDIGPSGFGYGDGDDNTEIEQVMSIYIVFLFNIQNIENIKESIFHIDYDDAFVAYLNGIEFSRANIGTVGTPPDFNDGANEWREAEMFSGGLPQKFEIDSSSTWFNQGENRLAIQVHNYNSSSSDMSSIPFLTIGRDTILSEATISDLLEFPITSLHTNFKIRGEGETIVLSSPQNIIIDSISTGQLSPDISIGRINQGEELGLFGTPTPAEPNGDATVLGLLNKPLFSTNSGFYQNFTTLQISSEDTGLIYFTVDGSDPEESSTLYTNQLIITSNTVVRAIVLKQGWVQSPIESKTYIFDNIQNDLPAVFLVTEPDNFFDNDSGIYVLGPNASTDQPNFGANFWEDWERPINIELLETDGSGFSSPGGVKIFGGWSRAQSQKSLSFFARSQYGAGEFEYKLFPDLEFNSYENFILRNSGNDWGFTMMRDVFQTSLFNDIDIEIMANRPVLCYLNGEFWGLYSLREKINENFLAMHHNINPNEVDLIEVNEASEGTYDEYQLLLNYLENTDMDEPNVFEALNQWIDIDNHINYTSGQIFLDNRDWPGNNIKYWREQKEEGKWRWILYDTDFGFGIPFFGGVNNVSVNTLEFATEEFGPGWPNPPWSTFLFRKLLENPQYKNRFINLYCDRLNTIFKPEYVLSHLDSISSRISSIIPNQNQRWPESAQDWDSQINILNNFGLNRQSFARSHLRDYFGLSNLIPVSVENNNQGGKVKINSYLISENYWTGYYFPEVRVSASAIPDIGYRFLGWQEYPDSLSQMRISITSGESLTAQFEQIDLSDTVDIIINEINYNSSDTFNPGDWVELYNPNFNDIDLGGWVFKDEEDEHIFTIPGNIIIDSLGFIVLVQDENNFTESFPLVNNYVGSFDFGLSGGGENIRIFNSQGVLIDEVLYDDSDPWPDMADGQGSTLELINPLLDNNNSDNWSSFEGYGTPGYENNNYSSLTTSKFNQIPSKVSFDYVFPNPFNSTTAIEFSLPREMYIDFTIYDLTGRIVRNIVNSKMKPGKHRLFWDGINNLGLLSSTGVYLCRLSSNSYQKTIKVALVK